MREIVTAAFASRPLEPQEARTGFLFFPRPAARAQKLTLTWSWYDCLTRELMALAARHSQHRIVSMLEGGYNLQALGRSAAAHVKTLAAG